MSVPVEPGQLRGVLPPATRGVVMMLCERGESNAILGQRLGLTEKTIKWHLGVAFVRSGTDNRTALALWWIRTGRYINDPDRLHP